MDKPSRHPTYVRVPGILVIIGGILFGIIVTLLSESVTPDSKWKLVLQHTGAGLIATAFISIALESFWSKERIRIERQELRPLVNKLEQLANQLGKLEGRYAAFKKLGLTYCHSSRRQALNSFHSYASEMIRRAENSKSLVGKDKVNILSSSARGLIGYLDKEAEEIQQEWRDLIVSHPSHFRILLTHPSYAHLRQAAEERGPGDIELEIIKTAVFLYFVAGMKSESLRLYRGSPTVFMIHVDDHILLNPYPYGKMAMNTLCLEFESDNNSSYVADFANMHFHHTWEFIHQDEKEVDGRSLVVGISTFEDILSAFAECTVNECAGNILRLTDLQVKALDSFLAWIKGKYPEADVPPGTPFQDRVTKRGLQRLVLNREADDSDS